MIVVSACLAGIACRYDGSAETVEEIKRLVKSGEAVAACPECFAGLKAPRPPAEISGGGGADVLQGRARVYNKEGDDITQEFIEGARKLLAFVKERDATRVILKAKSPSCGVSMVYDGSFTGRLVNGSGVAAALLMENDIELQEIP